MDAKEISVCYCPGSAVGQDSTDPRDSIPPPRIASKAFEPVEMWKTVARLAAASMPVIKADGEILDAASLILSTLTSERPW